MSDSMITGLTTGAKIGAIGAEAIKKLEIPEKNNDSKPTLEKINENEQIEVTIEEDINWKELSDKKMEFLEKQKANDAKQAEIFKQRQEFMQKFNQSQLNQFDSAD